jgi:hypothetical protein
MTDLRERIAEALFYAWLREQYDELPAHLIYHAADDFLELPLSIRRIFYEQADAILPIIEEEKRKATQYTINKPKEPQVIIPESTLRWWRELVYINPQDLAPRIDAILKPVPTASPVEKEG